MERLYALHLLYQVEAAARSHGHKDVVDWCHAEIKEHVGALHSGDTTAPAEHEADE